MHRLLLPALIVCAWCGIDRFAQSTVRPGVLRPLSISPDGRIGEADGVNFIAMEFVERQDPAGKDPWRQQ